MKNVVLLSPLTYCSGDALDEAQATTAIEGYRKEWHRLPFEKVHGMEYNPSWESFKELKHLGILVTLGGFDKTGSLKTFYVGVKGPHPYNPEWTYCQSYMLYIAPEYRKNIIAMRQLLKELDKQMKEDKVDLYSIELPYHEKLEQAYSGLEARGFSRDFVSFLKRT